jgi:hypothetical protein
VLGAAVAALATVAAANAMTAPAQTGRATSSAATLELRAVVRLSSSLTACPPGVSAGACASRSGKGLAPGLGRITEAYTWLADLGPPSCASGSGRALAYDVRLVVAGKGAIDVAVAAGGACVGQEALRSQAQAFVVTGGSGLYARASGGGTVERRLAQTAGGAAGTETWRGTLDVEGVEFDLTPPTVAGAARKTVRAPRGAHRVRVSYRITARDAVDGAVPVTCRPRSGARFRIGRTIVTCSATDTSGNRRTVRFPVTVVRRR